MCADRARGCGERDDRGGLPVPTQYTRQITIGDGLPCDGCGETIEPADILFMVKINFGLHPRLHAACYEAWLEFRSSS